MAKKMLVADLLCGAGGSSTGCARALRDLGLEMELVCINHWPTAIETHRRNHPEARHYVQDIATVRPHLLVPEGYLDLLMASPTCTYHSVARGGKPTSDQQRSDPWHIITWLTELRVKRAIIENVWEFISWGPVDPKTGKPIKERRGEYFRAWIETMQRLGYEIEWRKLNAADYGEATTRKRFILMMRNDGRKILWPAATHRKRDDGVLELIPGLQPWRPARDIIDWSLKGQSIFGRKKDLAPKTLARIWAGAIKLGWPEPFLVILRNHMDGKSIDGPVPAIAAEGNHIGLAEPVLMNGRRNNKAKAVSTDPVPALDTKGGVWLAEPLVLSQHSSGAARSTEEPLPTIMTGGAGDESHPGCARPSLVEAFVLSRQGGGAPRPVDQPTPAQVAKHSHVLVAPYYGSGSGETAKSADVPLDTVTAKQRFGLVVPVTNSNGGALAREVATDPLATMTTAKGGEFALVMPVTHSDGSDRVRSDGEPLPTITGANRGELAFITAQHGERPGQAPRFHDLDAPTPTIAATGHVDLVEPTPEYDILFRMLEPHELAAAMGLDDYDFAGTKTEKVRQIGNAVSRRKMQACVTALMADAAPRQRRQPPAMLEAAE